MVHRPQFSEASQVTSISYLFFFQVLVVFFLPWALEMTITPFLFVVETKERREDELCRDIWCITEAKTGTAV